MTEAEWERAEPWIAKMLHESGDTHTPEDIKAEIEADKIALVMFPSFAVLLSIIDYPRKKALKVVGIGGEDNICLPQIKKYLLGLPELTKQLNCQRLEATGRGGWVRAMKEIGMTSHAFMWKDIA